jgi:hypothetical protein
MCGFISDCNLCTNGSVNFYNTQNSLPVKEEVSPNSSPDEQYQSNDGAMKGSCRAVANSA